MPKYDFGGWATRNDLKCSDGRTIRKNAFSEQDGEEVPLVWNHQHSGPENVLGHALLENREDGVYARCIFNNNPRAKAAKEAVKSGDVKSLSIWANQLTHKGADVVHGVIREVSLVLAGANPGAFIDSIMIHGEECLEDGIIYTGFNLELEHADEGSKKDPANEGKKEPENKDTSTKKDDDETVEDVINSMTKKQQDVMYGLIALVGAAEEKDNKEKGAKEEMKHNVFDNEDTQQANVLSHSELNDILAEAKRNKASLRDTVLAHADGDDPAPVTYGIEHIDYLYPEARNMTQEPLFIKRPTEWVGDFMGSVNKSPFSRIKSLFTDITKDEARAKGYIKGNRKDEEVITLLKRKTDPTTIYKKQKLDRDDIIDITDFNVVSYLKQEMRVMLDEELARAMLVGDGRSAADDDKVDELKIRPIWTDDDLFTIKVTINVTEGMTEDQLAKAFIRAAIKSRKAYRGSGSPRLYTTDDMVTDMLLLTDNTGRDLYESEEKLARKLRVTKMVEVPVMENLKRTVGAKEHKLLGIIVNPADYTTGADKGGSINMFEDFDIDYNQEKYLMETRCSGALRLPYSAIVIEAVSTPSNTPADPEEEPAG